MLFRLTSLLGLFVFLFLAWALSNNRWRVPWRTVGWGIALQIAFALFILKTPVGEGLFAAVQHGVDRLNAFAGEGSSMVFGPLAQKESLAKVFGPGAYVFAFSITATIIVVSSISALLYHWGVLQRAVHGMAWVMRRLMKTSGSESLAAATNIFLGQTESALVIRPYVEHMTQSEIMALMTIGMATIASGVMAVYAQMGVPAGHLLTASVLSAPGSLLIAKIMFPETQESQTTAAASSAVTRTTVNGIDALCQGAAEGTTLAINIVGMLIAFVAVVAMANAMFAWAQGLFGMKEPATLQHIIGWLNTPFAWLMGIPWRDCPHVGELLGQRIVLNEFIGYRFLTEQKDSLDPRSFILASYALCGFANFGSIAIQIGGIGAIAPNRRGDLARLGVRAMIGGLISCYFSAALVGVIL